MNAVIYAAKSTEDKHGSIPTQVDDCRALAKQNSWEVVAEYSDEGFSAYKGNRGPGLARARQDAADRGAALIVQHSDRLARGAGDEPGAAEHLAEIVFWANRHSVQLRSVQDDSTFTSPVLAPVMAALMGMRNMEDSRRKSLAVAAGMKRRAAAGKATGGPRPYGYRYEGGGLVVVEHEAVIVRRVYSEFVAGTSITAIARNLHRDGVPSMRGGVWRMPSVSGILKNVVYTGRIEYDGEVYEGVHDAILPVEVFDQAQQLLRARPSRGRGRPSAGLHLFRSGMLRCGSCGEAMVPRTNGGYQMYYCNGRSKLGRDHCEMPHLRRVDIDARVYEYFERVGLDVEATRAQVAEARDRRLSEVRALIVQATRAEREASEALSRVKRDYTRGALSAEDWAELRPELTEERDGARAELERLQAQAQDVETWSDVRDAEAETYTRLAEVRQAIAGEVQDASGIDAVRAALLRLFERFVIHVDPTTKAGRIESVVRHDAIETVEGEEMTPVLRPTSLEIGSNNERVGLPWRYESGPE